MRYEKAIRGTEPPVNGTSRLSAPLPIRYKKERDLTYWVNNVDVLSEDGFQITMPVDLSLHDRIRFEIFDGGSRIIGVADVISIGNGSLEAGCRIVSQEKRNHLV